MERDTKGEEVVVVDDGFHVISVPAIRTWGATHRKQLGVDKDRFVYSCESKQWFSAYNRSDLQFRLEYVQRISGHIPSHKRKSVGVRV